MKSINTLKFTKDQVTWVAGLLEGEGYFGNSNSGGKIPVIQINMTDEDIIQRLSEFFECKYYSRNSNVYNKNSNSIWKVCYSVKISGNKARQIMELILPYMGKRRSAKIKECLRIWSGNPKRQFKPEDIINIRYRYSNNETILSLAKDYAVSPGTIDHIVKNASYKEI